MNNLLVLRKGSEKRAVELAELLGISRKHYYDLENGKRRLNEDHIKKLAEIYKCSTDEIMGTDEIIVSPIKSKKPKELLKFLEQEEFLLNGKIVTAEDRERILKLYEVMYWDAKEKNKRK